MWLPGATHPFASSAIVCLGSSPAPSTRTPLDFSLKQHCSHNSPCKEKISLYTMAVVTGAQLIARSLRDLGVTVIFGIVGIPVVEIAEEAINLGIRFVAFRNEQACSYAASVYGYMTGRPGVCLVVGGPGVLHALAGVSLLQHSLHR